MATIKLYIYSHAANKSAAFTDADEQESFTKDIWGTLTRSCEIERFTNTCGVILRNTQKTRDALLVLQEKYGVVHPEIRKLTMFASSNRLAENERFFVFDADKAKWSDRRVAIDELRMTSASYIELAMYHNRHYHNYVDLERYFDVYGYGFDGIKVAVGEPDKNKRKCRFCGCTDPTKYKDVAHAIQDSLGNKILVCYEECDDCNHKLNAVEDYFLHLITDKEKYFLVSFKVVFSLKYFSRYVRLEYARKGELKSLAIDIALRDYLFERAFNAAENKAYLKRKNTSFEVCDLTKLLQYKERLLSMAYWKVRAKKGFWVFSDSAIHATAHLP